MPPSPAFYVDWQFWSVVFAVIAIVLSQLPPVHLWFKPSRLVLDVHERISLTHKVGNPNITAVCTLRNTGGRQLRVASMNAEISREGAVVANAKLQNYWENAQAKAPTLFLPIHLDPGETWSGGANFYSIFDRRTEKEYRELERALKADVMQKLEDGVEPRPVAGADTLVSPFIAMFRRLFIWEPGEYQVKLSVTTDQNVVALEQTYRFTLFESDSQEFYAQVERFKFGEGIWYTPDPSQRDLSIHVPWTK